MYLQRNLWVITAQSDAGSYEGVVKHRFLVHAQTLQDALQRIEKLEGVYPWANPLDVKEGAKHKLSGCSFLWDGWSGDESDEKGITGEWHQMF